MQFVRQSKFRHVYCKALKREFCIEDVRVTKISWDSLFCVVNPKFIAIITEGSGGPFTVIPLTKVGRIDKDYPIVDAHRGPCLDISWCPFNDNVIASCSEDCTAKIWHIPDSGLHKNLKEPIAELLGHQKRVSSIVWHPTANNVLLTAGADFKIFIWNVATGEALIEIEGHPDLIWSVDFNYNGSKIVTTCKDKQIRVIDPRSGQVLRHGVGHEGMKPQRAIFLKDGQIFTTGFTKRSERVYALRDEKKLDSPIVCDELDNSNGVLFPLYDPDTGLVYLCGKGDCNIRYYEINDDPPFVHYINTYSASEPQRGIAFMPKRGLNVNENEIARIYKCTNKGLIDVLQFFVPRKSDLFQDDLYPDTKSAVPAISADEWINGKDVEPMLMPLRSDKATHEKPKAAVIKKSNILSEIQPASASTSSQLSPPSSGAAVKMRKTPPRTATNGSTSSSAAADAAADAGRASHFDGASNGVKGAADYKKPRIDDDMGIVDLSTLRQQQAAAEAAERREAAADGDRSRRVLSSRDAAPSSHPPVRGAASASDRRSLVATTNANDYVADPSNLSRSSSYSSDSVQVEDLVKEIQKLKAAIRGHDRRIRCVEDRLNERESKVFDEF